MPYVPPLQTTSPEKVLADSQTHRQWTWHGTTRYGQVTQSALTLVLCVLWTLPDPNNATTKAFQLSDVSVWSPLNSVKCSILNQMPAVTTVGKLEYAGLQPQTQLREVVSCVTLAELLPILKCSPGDSV